MLNITVNVDEVAASRLLTTLKDAFEDKEALHASMATAVEKEVKGHLQSKYVPRNKRGDFWQRVHDSVEVSSDAEGAVVSLVETGIGLRYYGGEVRPGKNPAAAGPNKGGATKALAVPSDAVPVRNGRQISPAFAGKLAFLLNRKGGDTVGYLVEGEDAIRTRDTKRGKKGSTYVKPKTAGELFYTLRKVTRHKPDKGILPNEGVVKSAAVRAVEDYLESLEE